MYGSLIADKAQCVQYSSLCSEQSSRGHGIGSIRRVENATQNLLVKNIRNAMCQVAVGAKDVEFGPVEYLCAIAEPSLGAEEMADVPECRVCWVAFAPRRLLHVAPILNDGVFAAIS